MIKTLVWIVLLTGVLISCTSSKTAVSSQHSKMSIEFDKQGHRGCRGLYPENTIPAMLHAIGLGVTTLEMDVVITKDKKVVLSHDPYFNHEISTKPNGDAVTETEEKSLRIYGMNYDEVKSFDVGIKKHSRFPDQVKIPAYKPLLSDLIDSVKKDMMTRRRPFPFYNIETKSLPQTDGLNHPAPAEFVELLVAVLKEKQIEDFVIIQSFDIRTLQYLHEHYPAIKTALLIEATDKRGLSKQLEQLGFTPSIYSPAYQLVNEKLIQDCHALSMKIVPWTVNSKELIEKYKMMGVDGLISDYPNLF